MNRRYQLGFSFRAGVAVGAGLTALLLAALVSLAAADRLNITPSIGSSKSVVGLDLVLDRRDYAISARLWRIAEKLDDDIGISPRSGATVDIDWNLPGRWRAGLMLASADSNRFGYVTAGIGSTYADAALLIPVNDSRFGLRARLRAPLSNRWYAQTHYEYTGRQDPDIKIVNIGLGIGRSF